jgi:predicted O-methyltransferase YrrM
MTLSHGSAVHWLGYQLGLNSARTQTTPAERDALARHAAGRRNLVEIGVMHGVTTRVLRSVMHPDGTLTAIDPHPRGRLGVSFERLVAMREVSRVKSGHIVFQRCRSHEAAVAWTAPIDFLFVDGDHSWDGIDADWRDWSPHVVGHGIVALHDSREVPGTAPLDSVRYTTDVILRDRDFTVVDAVDSLTVLERSPRSASDGRP